MTDTREHLRALRLLAAFPFRVDARRTVVGVGLLVISQLSTIVAAFVLKLGVDAAVAGDGRRAAAAGAGLVTCCALMLGGSWASFAVRAGMNEKTTLAIDTELTRLASGVAGIEHFERPDYLDKMQVLREEHQNLSGVPDSATWVLSSSVRLIVTAVVLAAVDWRLILLPLFAVPSLVANWRAQRRYVRTWDDITPFWRLQFATFRLAREEASGREVRSFGLRSEVRGRFDELIEAADGPLLQTMVRGYLEQTLGWVIFGLAFAAGMIAMADKLLAHRATAGDLVLVLSLGAQLNNQITMFVNMLSQLLRGLRTASKLIWLEDYHVADRRLVPPEPAPVPARLDDGIRFEHVTFGYPGTDATILRDVDLHLPAGSTVALVGDNGAGKTTIVKLLTGMYRPTAGRIMVDGVDLAALDPLAWRDLTSAAFQDFARFELTVQHVVGVGRLPDLDDGDAVTGALDRARATDVLAGLDDGLATQLGRAFADGHELSGGQWQKLALGRAMMRRAPLLLVLDEPTAALDAATEAALFERYATAARDAAARHGGITLLVSHRFSTVRMADLIVVIAGGTAAEVGSHTALMAAGGLYAELYDLQARAYQ